MKAGTRVRIERDETEYPSRGTWPMFKGRTATVTVVNRGYTRTVVGRPSGMSKKLPAFPREVKIDTEYGVSFGKGQGVDAWFRAHELVKTR